MNYFVCFQHLTVVVWVPRRHIPSKGFMLTTGQARFGHIQF